MRLRRLARDVLVYGAGDVVLRAGGLLTLPIYTRLLEPEEFGVLNYLVTLTFFLQAALLLGGDAALARFHFAARTQEERARIAATAVLGFALLSSAIALLMLPLSNAIADWSFGPDGEGVLVALAIATAPPVVVSALLGQVLRNQFRAWTYTLLNIANAAVGISLSLYFVVVRDLGVKGILLGTLIGTLVVLPPRLWVVRSSLRPVLSRELFGRLLRFGLPLVPAALALWAFAVSDRIVLGRLSTFRELGLYTVATSVASLITVLFGPFGQAWSPHALETYERDQAEARLLYGRVLTVLLAAFSTLGVVVTAFAPELLTVLAGSEFRSSAKAIAPLAIGAVAYASVQVTAMAFSLKHRTGTIAFVTWAAAVLNIALNVAFAARYGMLAAAWSTAASSLALTLLYAVLGHRLWPIRYEKLRTLAFAVVVPVAILAAASLPDLSPLSAVAKALYCIAFLALAAVISFGGNPLQGGRLLPTLDARGS
jgi:O-antigen/teichoic acid export membrane protein